MAGLWRIGRWVALAVLVIVLVVAAWARFEVHQAKIIAVPERARRHHRAVPVRTSLVADEQVEMVIGAPAVTEASEKAFIRFGVDPHLNAFNPLIRAVHVHEGQAVKARDVLFEFEDHHFQEQVQQLKQGVQAARAALAYAQTAEKQNAVTRQVELEASSSELEFRKTDVTYRREDYERLRRLRAQQNASFSEYLEAASAYAEARYKLTLAQFRHAEAEAEMTLGPPRDRRDVEAAQRDLDEKLAELALAKADLDMCQVRSPIDGYVDKVVGVVGQVFDVNMTLGEVLKVDPIHVRVDFPQERIGDLVLGQKAEVVLDSFPKETFVGRVRRIGARLDEELRVLPVIVEVSNPRHRIKVGVSGYVRIHVSREATTVPAIAVIGIQAREMAFVVQDGQAHIREVRTGPVTRTGYREVLEGLAAGDEVVVYGQQYLRDGEMVNSNWRQWARRD